MWRSFAGFFSKDGLSYELLENHEPKATTVVYRDNLSKNRKPKNGAIAFATVNPLGSSGKKVDDKNLRSVEAQGSPVVRVKITMTKKEAARLLSKSKEGVLGFKDVAHELVQIPVNRVTIVPAACPSSSPPAVLKSIPE